MSPSCSVRAVRSASNGSSTTVLAAAAERARIISPPTCESGIGHSQRSLGVAAERGAGRADVGGDVAERELDGARRAGGARGVDDQRDLVVARLADVEGRAAVLGERRVDEELGAAQQVLALALAEPRVDRHGGGAQQQAGVEGDHEGAAGGQRDRDAVAGRGAAADEPRGPARRRHQQLAVGQPLLRRLQRDRVGAASPARAGIDPAGARAERRSAASSTLHSGASLRGRPDVTWTHVMPWSIGRRRATTTTSATRRPRGSRRSPSTGRRCATPSGRRRSSRSRARWRSRARTPTSA